MKILAVCEAEFHLVQTEKVRKSPISSIFFASTSLYLSFFPLVNFVNFVEFLENQNRWGNVQRRILIPKMRD